LLAAAVKPPVLGFTAHLSDLIYGFKVVAKIRQRLEEFGGRLKAAASASVYWRPHIVNAATLRSCQLA